MLPSEFSAISNHPLAKVFFFLTDCDFQVYGYSDLDWASCPITHRSNTGYFTTFGNSPLSWRTKKQNIISCFSTEVEYRVVVATTCELLWLNMLLKSLKVPHSQPMKLFCDNQAALLPTLFFMNKQSILTLIATLSMKNSMLRSSPQLTALLAINLLIFSLKLWAVTTSLVSLASWALRSFMHQLEGEY
jgi:hypothetical protein